MFGRLSIKKISSWMFDTCGGAGVSVGLVAASGGTIYLYEPNKAVDRFYYGGVGGGLSAGLKIPRIGKIEIPTKIGPVNGTVGPTAFRSNGTLFVTDNFSGDDFQRSDITGVCAFLEVSIGVVAGWSGTALLLNLDPVYLPFLATPLLSIDLLMLINSAKGVLLMNGLNVGIQAQIGGASYLGYLK